MRTHIPLMLESFGQVPFDATKFSAAMEQLISHAGNEEPIHSTRDLIQWLDDRKAQNHIFQKRVGLNTLSDWKMNEQGHLVHKQDKFFKVIGIQVRSSGREVKSWSQPILDNVGTGIIGLLCRRYRGSTYYLMQAKAEPGNRTLVQIGPTVQFTNENYVENEMLDRPFLFDEFMDPREMILLRESRQSEEGARFYMEQHVHKILLLPEDRELELPSEYRWFSHGQIRFFLQLGEQMNSCARSVLACLL